jgi:hypothetical protein
MHGFQPRFDCNLHYIATTTTTIIVMSEGATPRISKAAVSTTFQAIEDYLFVHIYTKSNTTRYLRFRVKCPVDGDMFVFAMQGYRESAPRDDGLELTVGGFKRDWQYVQLGYTGEM